MPLPLAANLDYAIFVFGTLVAFAFATWGLRRWGRGAKLPGYVWGAVALILAGGWWLVSSAGQAEAEQIAQLVGNAAPIYARELARMGHANLTSTTPQDDPLYQRLIEVTREWMADNPHAHDIYTIRRLADGRRVFVLDGDTDYDHDGVIAEHERGAAPGTVYDVEDAGLDRALDGTANFDFEPITDSWGTWVGAWTPIYDAQGRLDGVVGVDYDARDWFGEIGVVRRDRIVQLALLVAVIGAAGGAIGVLRANLAERLNTEEQLRRASERWNLIVEQMPLAFIELDPQSGILAWNPAAERAFGFTAAEAIGRKGLDLIVPLQARAGIDALWKQLLLKSGGERSVNENVTKDGRIITCEWFNAPVVDHRGEVVSVIALAQDLTVRRNLELQVRQAQKMHGIGLLAAGIAHDFNNILTIVQGHAELLLGRTDLPKEAVEDIGRIAEATERAAVLTRQLLTFSRRQAMFARPIDLSETVAGTASMLGRVLGAQIRVVCQFAKNLPLVEADPSMLDQIVTNLAVNARDAMPRGGTLTIATRFVEIGQEHLDDHSEARPGPAVCLAVSDTGTGISADLLPSIFEPFFTTKEVGKGTGLGLAAVHGIVEQHHGWIVVNSALGHGTRFEIFLPCGAPLPAAPAVPAPLPEPARAADRVTILLVEDEPTVRQLARVALERAGYRVLVAADGPTAEAVWTRERENVALLCTDMVMPNGLSGRDLAGLFTADRPDLCVVFCSGYSVELTAPDFCESPVQCFLQKPYLPKDLLAAVRQCLSNASANLGVERVC